MNADTDKEIDVTTTEARSGVTGHGVRYVLAIGLILAVAAMAVALMVYAG
ncbi:MAG: hypothetical protein HC788_06585 [Sphingopyxis sp.]|nr:hypothetical protein [Sphingopyxis sp.]